MRSVTSSLAKYGSGRRIFITKSTTLTADACPPNDRSKATVSFISNDSEIKLGYGVTTISLAEFVEFREL